MPTSGTLGDPRGPIRRTHPHSSQTQRCHGHSLATWNWNQRGEDTVYGYFCGGFIFVNFASQYVLAKNFNFNTCLGYLWYRKDHKNCKIKPSRISHLIENHESICTWNIWRIQELLLHGSNVLAKHLKSQFSTICYSNTTVCPKYLSIRNKI